MKLNLIKFAILSAIVGLSINANAQSPLVENGASKTRIVVGDNKNDLVAAELLQNFIEQISDCRIKIITNEKYRDGDIVIGNFQIDKLDHLKELSKELSEDGFAITNTDGRLSIINGGGHGSAYGVVTILEDYLGVRYWADKEYSLEKRNNIELPEISIVENPTFKYRQTQCYAVGKDPIYKLWHRIEEPREVFAATYWVHTFDKLLPSKTYGKEHPEYYSFFNGKRHPGKASQWCLTNPDVLEIVSQRIDSIFKANPEMNIISVSQNDGNYTNCTCPNCKAIDDHEQALSGSVIYFLNKLAARFPDKTFSTLAYLYTMKPPKYIKPLPNVNIMLCDIDCNREVSLTENASGRVFVEAMEGWSKISNNIFVWDYGINFDNMVAPFPNFHILQDNIQLFKEHNTTMHFSQIGGSYGGDFAELRAYIVAKLMWDSEADVDATMQEFLNGYYGEAAPYIYKYIQMMTGALIASGERLWIYDSPVSHKKGMLQPQLMSRYNELFDSAEEAVSNNTAELERVRRARLVLQYSELEIARTESVKDIKDIEKKLNLFEERVIAYGIPTLNERSNSPVEYCQLYRQRYMPQTQTSIALGANINYITPPKEGYKEVAKTALTNGLFGGSTFVESWIGWEGTDGAFVVDLGQTKEFKVVETDFLHQIGQWILFPLAVTYSYSEDGENYTHWQTHDLGEDKSNSVKFQAVRSQSEKPLNARYIKVEVVGTKVCPEWHYGVGHPSWFFIDEVTVL